MSQSAAKISTVVEPPEPTAKDSGVPFWLVFLLAIMVYLGMSYFDRHSGWFDASVFEPYRSHEELDAARPRDPHGDMIQLGKQTFEASCMLCHQGNGLGKDGQFPPLAGSDWLTAPGPNRIGRIVLNGLSGPIRVVAANGIVSLNASMAPLGPTYNDKQLAAALTYVRTQWGNNAAEITPADIKKIRDEIGSRTTPFKPAELLEIPVADAPK